MFNIFARAKHNTNNRDLLNNLRNHTQTTQTPLDTHNASTACTDASRAFETIFMTRYLQAEDKHTALMIHLEALNADDYQKSYNKRKSDISSKRQAKATQAVPVGEPHFAD